MKKLNILFVSHGFPCYLGDIIYNGLVNLGHNVVDNPYTPTYHGMFFVDNIHEQSFIDKINNGLDNFLKPVFFNFPYPIFANNKYDLVIITSHRPEEPYIIKDIADKYYGKIPIVFIDGEEDQKISEYLMKEMPYDIYFMREYRIDKKYPEKVKPINFGVIESWPRFDVIEKKYSVSCMWSNVNQTRIFISSLAKGIQNSYISGRNLKYEEYMKVLHLSKIAISVKGVGQDTLRFWEILYSGSLLISEKLDLYLPDFKHFQNFVIFNNITELKEQINYFLHNPPEAKRIAKAGQELVMDKHTSRHQAEYILNSL